jgi:hypothetical protein
MALNGHTLVLEREQRVYCSLTHINWFRIYMTIYIYIERANLLQSISGLHLGLLYYKVIEFLALDFMKITFG